MRPGYLVPRPPRGILSVELGPRSRKALNSFKIYLIPNILRCACNHSRPRRLTAHEQLKPMENRMPGRIADLRMDAPTSRAVAKGIGEKLQQTLDTDQRCPDRLQKLLDEMRAREAYEAAARNGGS